MTTQRSLLFVPGDDAGAMSSSKESVADGIILDLEDTVSSPNKELARDEAMKTVSTWSPDDPTLSIRINGLDTPYGIADLKAVLRCESEPETVVVPDVRSRSDIEAIAETLDTAGSDIALVPIIERPEALFTVEEIARGPRVSGLGFGSVDFQKNTGMPILDSGIDVSLPRYLVSIAASAAGVGAFDTVYLDRTDTEGLIREARSAKEVGYDGKMAIDISQLKPINDTFSPSTDALARAQRVVTAFEESDDGVIFVEGTFVDKPVVEEQRSLLERGRELGILDA